MRLRTALKIVYAYRGNHSTHTLCKASTTIIQRTRNFWRNRAKTAETETYRKFCIHKSCEPPYKMFEDIDEWYNYQGKFAKYDKKAERKLKSNSHLILRKLI